MRDPVKTKAKLERAALGLFAAKGVSATTTRDLAEATGLAEGTLYRHYESKEALARALYARHYAALAGQAQEAAAAAAPAGLPAQVAALVALFCGLFERDRNLFRFLLLTQHDHLPRLPPDLASPVTVLEATAAHAMVRGEIPRGEPALAAALLLGAVLQPATFRIYGRLAQPLTELMPQLAGAALAAIGYRFEEAPLDDDEGDENDHDEDTASSSEA